MSRKFLLALSLVGVAMTHAAPLTAQGQPSGAPQAQNTSQALERAYAAYVEALRRYEDARTRSEHGREPLPGERVGIAGGGSRLRPEYFERQEKLERELETARAELEAARGRWNALR